MKLEKLVIKNFRGIESLEMDLKDDLGRIETRIPIVGPNTSGKTSILDAITLCLMPVTEVTRLRPDLQLSPTSLVRRGNVRAAVTCTVWFSDEEIQATRTLLERTGHPDGKKLPTTNQVTVRWTFPDARGEHRHGRHEFFPKGAQALFKGRVTTARNLHVPGVSPRQLQRLGGVFLFDQKRTGLAARITPELRALAASGGDALDGGRVDPGDRDFTSDPRLILLQLASRAQAPQDPEATEGEDFERLRELYAQVCKPHRIRGLYNTESGLDMEFEGAKGGIYLFNGLSSGQLMILLLLLQFARQRIHSSIVLIDELELHLHPLWQTRLYQCLPTLGLDNQYFFTTHSTHLRELIRGAYFHTTGELGDNAIEKEEA